MDKLCFGNALSFCPQAFHSELHPRLHHHVPLVTQVSNHLQLAKPVGGAVASKSPLAGDKQNL